MPGSKQNKEYKTAFYSRKYKKWFKTYEAYQKYDNNEMRKYYYKHAEDLVYSPQTRTIFSKKTGKIQKRI